MQAGDGKVNMQRIYWIAIVVGAVTAAYWLGWSNYSECREKGFSVRYCALSHLVR
jgi:uncharacterized membrane protein